MTEREYVIVPSNNADKPENILARIERLLVAIALANMTPENLVYMLTWLQWESMIHFFRTHYHPNLGPIAAIAFIHYKGITIMPPRTPPA